MMTEPVSCTMLQVAWSARRGLVAAGGFDASSAFHLYVWDLCSGHLDRVIRNDKALSVLGALMEESQAADGWGTASVEPAGMEASHALVGSGGGLVHSGRAAAATASAAEAFAEAGHYSAGGTGVGMHPCVVAADIGSSAVEPMKQAISNVLPVHVDAFRLLTKTHLHQQAAMRPQGPPPATSTSGTAGSSSGFPATSTVQQCPQGPIATVNASQGHHAPTAAAAAGRPPQHQAAVSTAQSKPSYPAQQSTGQSHAFVSHMTPEPSVPEPVLQLVAGLGLLHVRGLDADLDRQVEQMLQSVGLLAVACTSEDRMASEIFSDGAPQPAEVVARDSQPSSSSFLVQPARIIGDTANLLLTPRTAHPTVLGCSARRDTAGIGDSNPVEGKPRDAATGLPSLYHAALQLHDALVSLGPSYHALRLVALSALSRRAAVLLPHNSHVAAAADGIASACLHAAMGPVGLHHLMQDDRGAMPAATMPQSSATGRTGGRDEDRQGLLSTAAPLPGTLELAQLCSHPEPEVQESASKLLLVVLQSQPLPRLLESTEVQVVLAAPELHPAWLMNHLPEVRCP